MKKYNFIILLIFSLGLFSCDKFLEPGRYNDLYDENIMENPTFAEGILITAYNNMPNDYYYYYDVNTDDAVTNVKDSPYTRMATGEWNSNYYPGSPWTTAYSQIYYINRFLSIYENVKYSLDVRNSEETNALRDRLHKRRLKGEAYGLRGWYKWQLLQYYSGRTDDGTLMGFPIIDKVMSTTDNWKLPRNTFAECVASTMADLDTAIKYLPKQWVNSPNADTTAAMGAKYSNRLNGGAAIIFKSRVALLAASPAFSESGAVTWDGAAQIAGPYLKQLGSLYSKGKIFYTETSNKEMIWNRALAQKLTWERNNFPPSLYGSGNTNPSQNLVDAFPMKNGYPINNSLSLYNPANPYNNRDPRLADYIIYTGTTFKSLINTYIGASLNGINELSTSTRTGYYLKKFMDSKVVLGPSTTTQSAHIYTLARMTELLLNYAEAANEAWGPDGDPYGYGFTARTKIRDLRVRSLFSGVVTPDPYLASLDQNGLRELIRNERRLELCFEGFRFWDIRRWKDLTAMKTPVTGAFITYNGSTYTYNYDVVEDRLFADYMIYPPIPYSETLKYNIQQNAGW